MKNYLIAFLILFLFCNFVNADTGKTTSSDNEAYILNDSPLRVGVIGLNHDHVHGILNRGKQGDIEIVGIVESNRDLALRYSQRYGYPMHIVYSTMEDMLDAVNPEAVMAFNSTQDHLKVVEYCAPRGIHVMVEKPLAANLKDAEEMVGLANKNKIHLITNYETTWYGSNSDAYDIVKTKKKIGDIRKINFYTGHQGPIEIGCSAEFLEWLTDPVMNGGGALTDFGCYGANLATWLMGGNTPLTVSCITQQIKPVLYPEVEDEATIILTYPTAQVLIQASWNWPYSRKEMEVYGTSGYVFCKNNHDMSVLEKDCDVAISLKAKTLPEGMQNPYIFFSKVIKENLAIEPYSPSSLENNMIVMQILEAAKHSSETGSTVIWDEFFKPEQHVKFDDKRKTEWSSEFEVVEIKSEVDNNLQKAYFHKSKSNRPEPLVVSLHTWSGYYDQHDPLAELSSSKDINYIHPDFRGANFTKDACCSELALSDIDESISYAIKNSNVDLNEIFVIGVSGGGYATLSTYMKSKHRIKKFSAWASISDINAWYNESSIRNNNYDENILACTESAYGVLNKQVADQRSPVCWKTPVEKVKHSDLYIYAGVYDGIQGSVPITHSINFYNKLLSDLGVADSSLYVSDKEKLQLLEYRVPLGDFGKISGRNVCLIKNFKNIRLTIFEGNHEMLTEFAFNELIGQ